MGEYVPQNPVELHYYNTLFSVATNGANGELGGADAVRFFKSSGVDVGFLKQIWGMCTQGSSMNVNQFFTAMRLITMAQNGEFPITKGELRASDSVPMRGDAHVTFLIRLL
jgi:hypothetical protein